MRGGPEPIPPLVRQARPPCCSSRWPARASAPPRMRRRAPPRAIASSDHSRSRAERRACSNSSAANGLARTHLPRRLQHEPPKRRLVSGLGDLSPQRPPPLPLLGHHRPRRRRRALAGPAAELLREVEQLRRVDLERSAGVTEQPVERPAGRVRTPRAARAGTARSGQARVRSPATIRRPQPARVRAPPSPPRNGRRGASRPAPSPARRTPGRADGVRQCSAGRVTPSSPTPFRGAS